MAAGVQSALSVFSIWNAETLLPNIPRLYAALADGVIVTFCVSLEPAGKSSPPVEAVGTVEAGVCGCAGSFAGAVVALGEAVALEAAEPFAGAAVFAGAAALAGGVVELPGLATGAGFVPLGLWP
jgi:hypothetical protein